MNEQETVRTLAALDYDEREAVRAYEFAIPQMETADLSGRLEDFREEHDRHVRALDGLIGDREAPEPSEERVALLGGQIRMVERAPGQPEVMEALLMVEQTAGADYATALASDIPGEMREILDRLYAEDRAHADYVSKRTPSGVPEGGPGSGIAPGVAPGEGIGTGGSIGGAVSGAAPPRGAVPQDEEQS